MTQVTNTPYEALEVGQTASFSKTVEERDIQLFAAMSGDHNPVHLDAEFAAKSMFKERIAHGMFSGALISAAVACELPGPGTIYLGQTMSFQKPVKFGDTLTVRWKSRETAEVQGAHRHPCVQPERRTGGRWRGRDPRPAQTADRRAGQPAAYHHRLMPTTRPGGAR